MVNRKRPYVRILPEDAANAAIAKEFVVECGSPRQIQVLPYAGGKDKVVAGLATEHARIMRRDSQGLMILLIDLDLNDDFDYYRRQIPKDLATRVFVIGAKPNPEQLRSATNLSFTQLGEQMAKECSSGTFALWEHPLLKHNRTELERAREQIRPILFS